MAHPAATRAFEPVAVGGFDAERVTFRTSVFGFHIHVGRWFGVGGGRQRCGCGNGKGPRERTLGGAGWVNGEESFLLVSSSDIGSQRLAGGAFREWVLPTRRRKAHSGVTSQRPVCG